MKTFSAITIALFASLSLTILSQDCNNPLLERFGLAALDEPQSGSDLPYCNGLQSAETCCSADTVAGFQDRANVFIDKLNNYAAGKDLYLAQLRDKFYNRFRDIYSDLSSDSSDDHIGSIRRVNATLADELQSDLNDFTQITNDARGIDNQFKRALDDYQAARNNCYTAALQVQASAWCLACDPNYAAEGVADNGNVAFSNGLCQAINDACWPFFNESARFNPLVRAREAYWRLIAVQRYLSDYSDNNQVTPFTVSRDPYNPLSTQQATAVPDEWSGTTDNGQCSGFWSGDELLAELLTVNGSTWSSGSRLLQDVGGVWGPDLGGTGLDLDLLLNPGDVYDSSDSDYTGRSRRRYTDTSDH